MPGHQVPQCSYRGPSCPRRASLPNLGCGCTEASCACQVIGRRACLPEDARLQHAAESRAARPSAAHGHTVFVHRSASSSREVAEHGGLLINRHPVRHAVTPYRWRCGSGVHRPAALRPDRAPVSSSLPPTESRGPNVPAGRSRRSTLSMLTPFAVRSFLRISSALVFFEVSDFVAGFGCWAAFVTFSRLVPSSFDLAEELAAFLLLFVLHRHFDDRYCGAAYVCLPLVVSSSGPANPGPCTERARSRRTVNPLLAITAQPRTNQCLLLELSPVANTVGTGVRIAPARMTGTRPRADRQLWPAKSSRADISILCQSCATSQMRISNRSESNVGTSIALASGGGQWQRANLARIAVVSSRRYSTPHRRRLVDAYESLAGNVSVAAATDTQELYVGAKPANRLLLHANRNVGKQRRPRVRHQPSASCGLPECLPPAQPAMNARRAVSGGRLPELTSEHCLKRRSRFITSLARPSPEQKLPHDRTSEMTV